MIQHFKNTIFSYRGFIEKKYFIFNQSFLKELFQIKKDNRFKLKNASIYNKLFRNRLICLG